MSVEIKTDLYLFCPLCNSKNLLIEHYSYDIKNKNYVSLEVECHCKDYFLAIYKNCIFEDIQIYNYILRRTFIQSSYKFEYIIFNKNYDGEIKPFINYIDYYDLVKMPKYNFLRKMNTLILLS